MAHHQAMSMEAMLDEERKEVLALLEGTNPRPRPPSSLGARSQSPYTTPRSPVRSMLDIAPVRSMLDVDSPPPQPIRSMLDIDSPPSSTKQVLSTPSSPTESHPRALAASTAHLRSMSDAGVKPDFGPRSKAPRHDPTSEYQFSGIITTHAGQPLPKRVTQGGKRSSAMAEVMRGSDVPGLALPMPGDRGRHHSAAGPMRSANASKSPHNRPGMRSHSPGASLLARPLSPAGRALLGNQADFDINNAYRRLSNAALARAGGTLGELGRRKLPDDMAGSGRLAKDYLSPDGDLLVEESSDDNGSSSDEEHQRGRKAARNLDDTKSASESTATDTQRQAKSLMAAAEEERAHVVAKQPAYKYRSLLDEPEITVTNPSGERVKNNKTVIHPATSFDNPPGSDSHTPVDSDTEQDLTDIKRAQKLSFAMTQIMGTPESHRTIQIITRGEYSKLVQEAEEEHRPPRKYLVATDLSDESTHALEWAIGTVLRDGDTLLAIYCVDEETGITDGTGAGGQVPDEPRAMKEQAAAINTITSSKTPITSSGTNLPLHNFRPLPLLPGGSQLGSDRGAGSVSASPAPSRERSKAEEERYRAVHDISERVTKLLRKTRLQVRVIVEVLHCKNPKHLITEVIDLVNPTLVILGSRGRSALKGVILGSFSNYLVTKSSVPVMVARKRLRKQGKFRRVPSTHQINNIHNPAARSLASAKID
ncbi:adenine nucleotide alpha hydrolases-like protein [Trichocladium antarcticum]|uniref:Adenine nucleotide alpha hydrolases-like protein n=1 Tax=Trichocladium antarcticum TaxID=1450529 RepID=A0AAN6UDD0_9PEZI|nr:adenine nucleotide alpha hydrolases-like protein [Trichocladium antarcticum]